jgi:hypothetical protein
LSPTPSLIYIIIPDQVAMHMVEDTLAMASLNAAKQQLRLGMKQKLGAISNEAAMSQSTTDQPRPTGRFHHP